MFSSPNAGRVSSWDGICSYDHRDQCSVRTSDLKGRLHRLHERRLLRPNSAWHSPPPPEMERLAGVRALRATAMA